MIKVYIAGDWLRPPTELAKRFELEGYSVPYKWWEDRISHKENIQLLIQEINDCDWFVFDMRTDRYDKHKFGGSHVGTGIALALKKIVKIIMPTDAVKPFTAILTPFITKNEDLLFTSETHSIQDSSGNQVVLSDLSTTDESKYK